MSERDKIREELEGLSPLLSKMKGESRHPFRVPEGYFDGLPDEVLRRARAEEGLVRDGLPAQGRAKKAGGLAGWLQWWLMPRQAIGLAMALVLLAAGAYLFWAQSGLSAAGEVLAGISEEEAKAYVSENIGEFGLDLMVEAAIVSEEGIPGVEVLPEIDEVEIDRYLDDYLEDISLDELEELL